MNFESVAGLVEYYMPNELSTKLRGRIFGLRTKDGRRFNARLSRETQNYVTIADNNNYGTEVKIAKTNIANVTCG